MGFASKSYFRDVFDQKDTRTFLINISANHRRRPRTIVASSTKRRKVKAENSSLINMPPCPDIVDIRHISFMNLHQTALTLAKTIKRSEAELLEVLMRRKAQGEFIKYDFLHLFDYAVRGLGLSASQAEYFNRVAEKASEVPELKVAIDSGTLTLSKARRIVPVITSANSSEWITKACELKQTVLEKAVKEVNPSAFIRERIKPVAKNRSELKLGVSDQAEKDFRRVQDILSQKLQRAASMEDVLEFMLKDVLERHDPVKKAERASSRKSKPVPALPGRRPIPKAVEYQVVRRDQGQCVHVDKSGRRCPSRRWLQIHHRVPVSQGGLNTVGNLVTLCGAHHGRVHQVRVSEEPKYSFVDTSPAWTAS